MKSVVLYYFSGTGNTEIVTNMIKAAFEKQAYQVDLVRIEDVMKDLVKIELTSYEFVGIGCQVIGFGTPRIVGEFVKLLPKGEKKKTFVYRTAGGVAPINYNVSKLLISALGKKGFDVFYERIFSIGSNWIKKFDDADVRKLHHATGTKVEIMCKELLSGKERMLSTGLRQKVMMGAAARLFPAAMGLVGKDLKTNDACNGCGNCIRNCPSSNIYQKNDKIKFRWNCNGCLRCVYGCPQNAIHFRVLSFFPVKGGYDINKTLSDMHNCPPIEKVAEPPFLKEYMSNIDL